MATKPKTKTKKPKPAPAVSTSGKLPVKIDDVPPSEVFAADMATLAIMPAANLIVVYASPTWGKVDLGQVVLQLCSKATTVQDGDLKDVEAILTGQAVALNNMFGELGRRAGDNMGEYMSAADTYMRLALRAQNQCRSTLETLAAIKNPAVVFAKQANISHGPQQVNNGSTPRAEQMKNPPTELLEHNHDQWLDSGTTAATSRSHSPLEAVATIDRSTKRGRKSQGEP